MCRFKALAVLVFIAAVILPSCKGGKSSSGVSQTTGWEYNNPDNGGFEVALSAEQATGPGLVLIEGGRLPWGRFSRM